jgi:hypothetical protein
MVLAGGAPRGLGAPFPHDLAVPIELPDGPVVEDAVETAALGRAGQLHQDVAELSSGEGRVDQFAGKAHAIPSSDVIAFEVHEMGAPIRCTVQDVALPGAGRIVDGGSRGMDSCAHGSILFGL